MATSTSREASVATKPYRVVNLAVSYFVREPGFAPDGSETTVPVRKVAQRGETVELSDVDAQRLSKLGPVDPRSGERGPAVKPAESPKSYDEMHADELKKLAEKRGVEVKGSGANGAALKDDYVAALSNFDQGAGDSPSGE